MYVWLLLPRPKLQVRGRCCCFFSQTAAELCVCLRVYAFMIVCGKIRASNLNGTWLLYPNGASIKKHHSTTRNTCMWKTMLLFKRNESLYLIIPRSNDVRRKKSSFICDLKIKSEQWLPCHNLIGTPTEYGSYAMNRTVTNANTRQQY